ncbi:SMP-30/Gluconolaconase/LRE domain-containing protein [Histoplasma capsulatum var. duboisii H88]|uniref:RNA polymerase subunit RPO26 n=1 Tax=Ajellomyces capsulatus (strain H88) TaxID=544711 RepID=F0UD47_AJEC8|nr:SMP-30/Gluconolaconase/LRE domain-containing protein [Histoplasma capsulatum var. duboisii H88]QSS49651.1 RNA polymerase subunit RPO26 [Histoplasma capsulatum var. duboisii H88]
MAATASPRSGPGPSEPPIDGGGPFYKCDPAMVLGEAPIYRASDSTLHWFDCLNEPAELHILHVDPDTGAAQDKARILKLQDSVSVAFFRKGKPGSYIAAYYQGICYVDEETGKFEILKEIIPTSQRDELRFNDGGIDARGRFWLAEIDKKAMAYGAGKLAASYGEPKGRVWRYDPDGSLHLMGNGFICGNGLAWSPDNKTMYINDSAAMLIYAYDFDLESGSISNKRILVDRRTALGEPDGMVIDKQGNLWVAVYSSSRIMVFSPDGKHLKDIILTARNVTCTTWGGRNWDLIFATTAQDPNLQSREVDDGGHMFLYKPQDGSRGQAKLEFAG